jgi:outer membrane protein assembly factor BamB
MMQTTFPLRTYLAAAALGLATLTVGCSHNAAPVRETAPDAAGQAAAPAAAAPGWTMFGGTPQRNMVSLTEKNLPDDWDVQANKNIKWVAKLGSRAYGGPIIAGGKTYVGTNNNAPRNPRDTRKRKDGRTEPIDKGVLMCFEEATGKFLWQHVNDKLPSGNVNDWPHEGVCSTPLVEGDRVYYVSNRCEVVCLDANGLANGNQGATDEKYTDPTDADVLWQLDMIKEMNVFPHNLAACSPVSAGDVLLIVTANGVDEGHINLPSPDAPSFIGVDKASGKVLWKDGSPGRNIMHGQWANAAYAEVGGRAQAIFPGGDGWLYSLEPKTGKLLWKFDANPKDSKYELGGRGTRSDFIATPVVSEGKVYIATGQDPEHLGGIGHLWCIDPTKSGDVSPELVTEDNPDPAKRKTRPNPNAAVVWHFGGPEKNPAQAGRDEVFSRTMSTCAIHDGLCYVADLIGFFYCLDAKTGQKLWVHDTKAEIWGSPLWVDGKVYLGTGDGDVFIYKHGRQKAEPKKVEMNHPVRSTPVAVKGVLYVMTESHLYAIQAK